MQQLCGDIGNKITRFLPGKLTLLLLLIMGALLPARAQKIIGHVITFSSQPVETAEVIIMLRDSFKVESGLTNKDGFFLLHVNTKGAYVLQVKLLGRILLNKEININGDTALGNLQVNANIDLSMVVVTSRRRVVEQKLDRIIYNVSRDSAALGSNLMEALQRAPRLNVNQGNISIVGKCNCGVKVLINGRPQNMSQDALIAMIKGFRAEQIEKVEVIPNPPAKYSAEGNGGMINIILKRDQNSGLHGSVNTDLEYRFGKLSAVQGLNLNYKEKKVYAALNISGSDYKGSNLSRIKYDFNSTSTEIENTPEFEFKNLSVSGLFQYSATPKLTLGLSADYYQADNYSYSPGITHYLNKVTSLSDSVIMALTVNKGKPRNNGVSIFADKILDSLGKKLTVTANYSFNKNPSASENSAQVSSGTILQDTLFTNSGNNRYRIIGLLADAELPFKFGKIETGLAYTHVSNKTQTSFYDQQGIFDPLKSNRFNYTENTFAGYFSFQHEWNRIWSAKAGVRIEHTALNGASPTLLLSNDNNYTKIFPTAYLSYNPNDRHSFYLSYSKRLDRPGFFDLNPFRYYTNKYNYSEGNPWLLPTLTHSLELDYNYKNNLSIIPYYTYTASGIAYVTELDNDNAYATQPINNYRKNKFGLIASYSLKPFKWHSIRLNADGFYSNLVSRGFVQEISGWGGYFSIRNTIELNKAKTSLLQVVYMQYLPSPSNGDEYERSSGECSVNFKQQLFKKSLSLNLWLFDIFRQNITYSYKNYNSFRYSNYNDIRLKGITLSLVYNFGNQNVDELYRDNKNYERQRATK